MRISLGLICAALLGSATIANAGDVCTKDGQEVKVEGKTSKAKKADCKAKGGSWEKKTAGQEQSEGGGGGW